MKLIIVTQNKNKVREFQEMMGNIVTVQTIYDLDPNHIPAIEDGATFEENAIKKIESIQPLSDTLFLADDSGLCIESLNNTPGIYSARFANDYGGFKAAGEELIRQLSTHTNRNACFQCAIALKDPKGYVQTVLGRVDGSITTRWVGTKGFGYDPIFKPNGENRTFAEFQMEEKNQVSHRAKALEKLFPLIEEYIA